MQPQPVVRSFAVGFSPISVFFPVQRTGPANTTLETLGDEELEVAIHVHRVLDGMDDEGNIWSVVSKI